MAITQTICNSFKLELMQGVHDLDTDTLKVALYDNDTATLDASTTVYTTTGEVTGTGYTAGGKVVTLSSMALDGTTAKLELDDVTWNNVTITEFNGFLLYNSSKGNKAIAVYTTTAGATDGTITVQLSAGADAVLAVG